jgi:hypothetical protein
MRSSADEALPVDVSVSGTRRVIFAPRVAMRAIATRVDQLGVCGCDSARRADKHLGVDQVQPDRGETAHVSEGRVAHQDGGALGGAIENHERGIAPGPAPMHEDGVPAGVGCGDGLDVAVEISIAVDERLNHGNRRAAALRSKDAINTRELPRG